VLATSSLRPSLTSAPWVRTARFDLLALIGVPAVLATWGVLFWPLLAVFVGPWYQALAANPHLTATYVRLGTEPSLWRRWRAAAVLLPAGLLLAVVAVYVLAERAGLTALVTLAIGWAYWHYARQAWGVARLYQRRLAGADTADRWLLSAAIHIPAVAAAIWWLSRAPEMLIGLPLYAVPLPSALTTVCVWVAPLAILPALGRARRGAGAGRTGRLDLATAVTSGGVFYLALVINPDPEAGYFGVSLWHTVQYLAVVYVTQKRVAVSQGGPLLWLTARPWCYYLAIVVTAFAFLSLPFRLAHGVGLPEMAITVAGITTWLVVTLHHYLLDTWIWGAPPRRVAQHSTATPEMLRGHT
jgi:hypothetical protein